MAEEAPRCDSAEFTARSTILAALIALAGVLIGIGGTYLTTGQEAKAAQERSNAEFVRAQQLAAYSEFLADSEQLESAYFNFMRLVVTNRSRHGSDSIATIKKPVDDAFQKVNQDVSMISIVGSLEAAVIAQDVLNLDYGRYGWVRAIELLVNINAADEEYNFVKDELRKSLHVDKLRLELLLEFRDQARKDLDRK